MINIKIDSRKVVPGDTFIAIKGATVDGHDFIEKAIQNGATKVVVDRDITTSVETVKVDDTTEYMIDYISKTYQDEINELNIIGITGTNGKTTTAYLTYQLLNALDSKSAYIGTIGYYVPGEEVVELPNTTPVIIDLYDLILEAKRKGCKNLVMEVSSHALDQRRVEGLKFKVGAFTNLTQDHLDYHGSMEEYLAAKLKLLDQLDGPMVVNADDEACDKWNKDGVLYQTMGYNGKNYQILSFENVVGGTKINFMVDGSSYEVVTNLKNEFNVYNYMTALAMAHSLGYSVSDIIAATNKVYPPRGRCEIIPVFNAEAVIDYAHTPDAVLKIISSFNQVTEGKVYTLIGCGGDRDPLKRPIMGRIATENSDFVVFTSDNPRTEDPALILEDILAGVTLNNYEVVIDRREAIRHILSMLKDKDTALILGKGHEDYQIIGREKIHLDDAEEVRKYVLENRVK